MTAHAGRTASGSRRLANPTGTPAWAVAFMLAGCAGNDALVTRAVDRWEAACGRRPDVGRVTWQYAFYVRCSTVENAVGCTRGHDITVASLAENTEGVVLHEVGHVLGVGHHAGHGVMVESMSSSRHTDCITQDDLDGADCPAPHPECRILQGPARP